MARTRSLLLKSEIRPAGRACDCKHNKRHRISMGDRRLVVTNPGPATGENGYCTACAAVMIQAAREHLDQLAQLLGLPAEPPEHSSPVRPSEQEVQEDE